MSVPSVAANAASIDWNIVAGAIGTLVATAVATWVGLRSGKKKTEANASPSHILPETGVQLRGGVLMDNLSMMNLTAALEENSRVIEQNSRALSQVWEKLVEMKAALK